MKINKFVMVCLSVAAAGLVIGGIGFLCGGRVYGFSLGGKGVVVNSNQGLAGGVNMKYIEENKELEAFNSFDMEIAFSDVTIKESDHYGIEYRVREDSPITEEMQGDKMVIKQKRPSGSITIFSIGGATYGNIKGQEYVILYVPKGQKFDSVTICDESGDIKLGNLQADQLTLSGSFGNLDAQALNVGTTDIRLESGDISIEELDTESLIMKDTFGGADIAKLTAGNVDVQFESGDITIDDLQADQLTVEDTFGQVIFGGAKVTNRFYVNIESGDIEFDQVDADEIEMKTTFGYIEGKAAAAKNIIMDLESGDCSIDDISGGQIQVQSKFGETALGLREGAEAYSVDAETSFGSLTVNGDDVGTKYRNTLSDNPFNLTINNESGDVKLFDAK